MRPGIVLAIIAAVAPVQAAAKDVGSDDAPRAVPTAAELRAELVRVQSVLEQQSKIDLTGVVTVMLAAGGVLVIGGALLIPVISILAGVPIIFGLFGLSGAAILNSFSDDFRDVPVRLRRVKEHLKALDGLGSI